MVRVAHLKFPFFAIMRVMKTFVRIRKSSVSLAASAWAAVAVAAGPGTFFEPTAGTANAVADVRAQTNAAVHRTVAFLGGSITEMNGYRPLVMKALRAKFPDVAFTEIAAGLSSTCSDAGAFRVDEAVLSQGLPDLFIVEFSVNDEQDGHFGRARCIRGMEGVVRHVREANPRCAVVVGLTVNKDQFDLIRRGGMPVSYAAHAAVAKRYGAALADVGSALAASAAAGGLDWTGYRDCHPSPEGCQFAARVFEKAIDRVFDPHAEAVPQPLPAPLDTASYFRSAPVPPRCVTAADGGWRREIPDWNAVPGNMRVPYRKGAIWWSDRAGATLDIAFEGTTLAAFVTAGPDAGDLEVAIDGGSPRRVRLRADYGDLHYPYVEILADDLPRGRHHARLRVLAADRNGSTGTTVRLHRLYANGGAEASVSRF